MKLQDQVTSLKLSRKLKGLKVKQESVWYWCSDTGEITFSKNCEPYKKAKCGQHLSRFTVAELGEMLPKNIKCKNDIAWLQIEVQGTQEGWSYQKWDNPK